MSIAEDLLFQRQLKGLRIAYYFRIIISTIGIFLISITSQDIYSFIINLSLISCEIVVSIIILKKLSHDYYRYITHYGVIGCVMDITLMIGVPLSWYLVLGGYEQVPLSFFIKINTYLFFFVDLVITSLTLYPLYPVIITVGRVIIEVIFVILAFLDKRSIITWEYKDVYFGKGIHPGDIFTNLIFFVIIGYTMYKITQYAQNTVREAVQYEEKLIQQEKLAVVGSLTAGLAHEVKNQLNSISFLELISSRFTDNERLYMKYIYDSRDRISSLVDEVRALAKNEEISYTIKPHSIQDIIEESIALVKMDPDVKNKSIQYEEKIPIIVLVDKNKIIQVMLNLLRNSAHAIDDKKIVGEIIIKTKDQENYIAVKIIDNGIGMDQNRLSNIWQPFYTTKGEKGTGIGLGITKRIIEGHGGEIHCESILNHGTTFHFTLPKQE